MQLAEEAAAEIVDIVVDLTSDDSKQVSDLRSIPVEQYAQTPVARALRRLSRRDECVRTSTVQAFKIVDTLSY